MKLNSFYIFIFLLLVSVTAQERLQMLQRLDRELDVAQYLLRENPDDQAEQWLQEAQALRDQLDAWLGNGQRERARQAGLQVHQLAQRIIEKLAPDYYDKRLQSISDLIDQAERAADSSHPEARRLLNEARKNLQLAQEHFNANRLRPAFEAFRSAEFQANRALRLVQGDFSTDPLENEQQRFNKLLTRAESVLLQCDNTNAKELYDQAREKRAEINDLLADNKNQAALQLYYLSTRLLLRAIALCEGHAASPSLRAEQEIQLLQELLQTAQNQVRRPMRSRMMLRRATRLLQQAQTAMVEQNYEQALQYTAQARNWLARVMNTEPEDHKDRVEQEIQRLQQKIDRASGSIESPRQQALLQAAKLSLDDAKSFAKQGAFNLAVQSVLAGNQFLSALQTNIPSVNRAAAEAELSNLQSKIADAQQHELDEFILRAAENIRQRVVSAIHNGNYDIAATYARLGIDVLETEE